MPNFVDYVYDFYGHPTEALYPLIKDGKLLTKDDIISAFNVYRKRLITALCVNESRYSWGDGDSLDRERVRDILINDFHYTWGA
jgi:hypothetical protein|tara:strand:- start:162 stop:413 length:252 start_codon:yes stop_codon:yes gene_type:complete